MANTIQTQDAFAAGWDARQAGVARTANPFSRDYDVQDWNFGWDDADRTIYEAAERAERLAECEERAARLRTRAYAAEWSEPGPDPLSPDKRAALNGALAQIERAFGKRAVVPASRMEAA